MGGVGSGIHSTRVDGDPSFMWCHGDDGFEVGYFEHGNWRRMQQCASKAEAVAKVHALYNERTAQKKRAQAAAAEAFAAEESARLPMPAEAPEQPPGQRCRLSKEGRDYTGEKREGGVIVGESKDGLRYRVVWDGKSTPVEYAKELITEI